MRRSASCGTSARSISPRTRPGSAHQSHEKEVNDILLTIKEMDKKENAVMSKFVAQHLDKLPRVTPGEIDAVSLLQRISMLKRAMSSMQQCVTRHDSVLSAATKDNSAASLACRLAQAPPAQMPRPTESASCDMARQLHNIRMVVTPQAAPPSTQTSASVL